MRTISSEALKKERSTISHKAYSASAGETGDILETKYEDMI
jgi:hypothetical protein